MTGSKTIAIMQPTYLPWAGYLDMIDQCDLFVLYDCVQFDKRSWQQRNRVKTAAGETWLTVPVLSKGKRDQTIQEVEVDSDGDFRDKHARTLQHAYGRAACYAPYAAQFSAALAARQDRLADLNADVITWMCAALDITTPLVRSSSLAAQGHKVGRLLSVCKAVGATRYLSSLGSHVYIDQDNRFADHGIDLVYHRYEHPVYPQPHGPFVSHMSAIDLILNTGPAGGDLLRSGRRPTLSHAAASALLAAQ